MIKTSHVGLGAIGAIVASSALSSVCGSQIDVTTLDYAGIIVASVATFFDMYKRRNQNTVAN